MHDQPTPLRPGSDPRVDVGCLASGFQFELASRLANVFVRTIGNLEDDEVAHDVGGFRLNHTQQVELLRCAFQEFDGCELAFARQLKDELEASGVTVWGLTDEHERLLGKGDT